MDEKVFEVIKEHTLRELQQIFTKKEACLILDALNGHLVSDPINPKEELINEITDAIKLQKLDTKWQVDKEKLLSKLTTLTSFQSYIVLQTAADFWELGDSGSLDSYVAKISS